MNVPGAVPSPYRRASRCSMRPARATPGEVDVRLSGAIPVEDDVRRAANSGRARHHRLHVGRRLPPNRRVVATRRPRPRGEGRAPPLPTRPSPGDERYDPAARRLSQEIGRERGRCAAFPTASASTCAGLRLGREPDQDRAARARSRAMLGRWRPRERPPSAGFPGSKRTCARRQPGGASARPPATFARAPSTSARALRGDADASAQRSVSASRCGRKNVAPRPRRGYPHLDPGKRVEAVGGSSRTRVRCAE
jgi:hypothetical protein